MTLKKVYVGLSGGVDSSVTAALLKNAGYDVTCVYMKNWSQDIPGFECPWKEDYQDAKRVAVKLDLPLKVYDFEKQYRRSVVDYMIDGYKSGITPNPDIMCNQEIKFKLFLETALSDGADMIATGHYARVKNSHLMTAKDEIKDQTYFLYRMSPQALTKVLMPIGDYLKPEVRKLASELDLPTADKKDSQGICFIGKVGIKEFLLHELGPQPIGDIVDDKGQVIGKHDGAIFYTIGQRHGLDVGGGLPYYVTNKDMDKNEVYVTTNLNSDGLWHDQLKLSKFHFTYPGYDLPSKLKVRTRYRAKLVDCKLTVNKDTDQAVVTLEEPIRAITAGQSAVFYDNDYCIGGGIVV
jgi:tRNA-specific 2-thiouridylase